MINIGLSNIDNEWHVLTLLGRALLCRFHQKNPEYEKGWDFNEDIIEVKSIPELHEGICVKCSVRALAHYMRDDDPRHPDHKKES